MKYSTVRSFLENLPKKGARSLFIAGSRPKEVEAGHDLDVFIIVNLPELNNFLDMLHKESELFCKKENATYTFFRGPFKVEEKPLIHYVIYTNGNKGEIEAFQNEPPQVVNNIVKEYDLISGDAPEKYISEMSLSDVSAEEREKYMFNKAEPYFTKREITYKSWQKKGKGWAFLNETIKLTMWQFKALNKYFKGYEPRK